MNNAHSDEHFEQEPSVPDTDKTPPTDLHTEQSDTDADAAVQAIVSVYDRYKVERREIPPTTYYPSVTQVDTQQGS